MIYYIFGYYTFTLFMMKLEKAIKIEKLTDKFVE